MDSKDSLKTRKSCKCLQSALVASLFCLASFLHGAAPLRSATLSVARNTQKINTAPKQYKDVEVQSGVDDPNRFHVVEVYGGRESGCVFASVITAIETEKYLKERSGIPLVVVDTEKTDNLRDCYTSTLLSLVKIGAQCIKSIDFDANGKPHAKFSSFKFALLDEDGQETLRKFVRALGVDGLTLNEETEISEGDLEDRRDVLIKKRAELDAKQAKLDAEKADRDRKLQDLEAGIAAWDERIRENPNNQHSQDYTDFLKKATSLMKQIEEERTQSMNEQLQLLEETKIHLQKVQWEACTWLCDTKDLPSVLIKLAKVLEALCSYAKEKIKESDEAYDANRWSEFAIRQAEDIRTTEGIGSNLYVVFGMLPAPYGKEGELFCERYTLNVYNEDPRKPTRVIVEKDSFLGNIHMVLTDRYFYKEGCPKIELNLLSCTVSDLRERDGQRYYESCGHSRPLIRKEDCCWVLYRDKDDEEGGIASQSFPVIVKNDENFGDDDSVLRKNYMDAIMVQSEGGTPGAEGQEKFSVIGVRKNRESALAALAECSWHEQTEKAKQAEKVSQRNLDTCVKICENLEEENKKLRARLRYYKNQDLRRLRRERKTRKRAARLQNRSFYKFGSFLKGKWNGRFGE